MEEQITKQPQNEVGVLTQVVQYAEQVGTKLGDWLSDRIDDLFNVEHQKD